MLPSNFNLDDLDDGIRQLVIDLNRIPELHTMTNCEGHIWRDTPAWPTKDGWVHFFKPEGLYKDLVLDINAFGYRRGYYFFNLIDWGTINSGSSQYTIEARFDQHNISFDSLFERMDKRNQRDYLRRARTRKQRILQGWNELDKVVIDYIKRAINQDYQSLPFI